MKSWLSRRFIAPSLIVLAVLIVLVTWLAPSDKILGERVKFVYVHGAIIRVVLGTFLLSGLLGIGYLIWKKPAFYEWSQALQEASLLLWIPYVVSSLIATLQAWGAIAWFEPRWVVTLQVSVIAPMAYVTSLVLKNRSITAVLNVIVAAMIFFLTSRAGLVLHPIDPIGTSGDAAIISSYLVILLLSALFALQLARGVHELARRRQLRVQPASA